MKPGNSCETGNEIVEIHSAARSPSPRGKSNRRQTRKLSNGHTEDLESPEKCKEIDEKPSRSKDSWVHSDRNGSLDVELPIHDQIKQGILGFVENEFKKSDKPASFVFYSHDANTDERFMKTLSRPSSGHKEKRSPSYRKKRRHTSKHRDRDATDFELPGSSLSALEKVDDYLKEYNKDEIVTLSGELDIEANDVVNNNGNEKEHRSRHRKGRKKARDDRIGNASRDISPKVFKTASKAAKSEAKLARPKDLSAMIETLENNISPYQDQYIDNPFSSPSPLTSPNDERLNPFGGRSNRIYLQGGGTFRAVSRDKVLQDTQNNEEQKYLRLGDLTPLDVALSVQRAWRDTGPACHGMLGGLSLMHLIVLGYTDGMDAGHLSFHAVVTMPYVAAYYFLSVCCLLSVLDRLDVTSLDLTRGLQPYFQPIVLVILYSGCLLVCASARMFDELMVYQYTAQIDNATVFNVTTPTIPTFYARWAHLSVWRAVLSLLGLAYFVLANPQDMVLLNQTKLLRFKHSLQSIG